MQVWLNIPENSTLIKLLNLRQKYLSFSDSVDVVSKAEIVIRLDAVNRCIAEEIAFLAAEGNLVEGVSLG